MGILFRWILGPLWVVLFERAEATRQASLLWTLAVSAEKQFPFVPFLEALADETGGSWRWKVRGLSELVAAGVPLPDALEAMPGIVPADTLALVRVGAETGNMAAALRDASLLARRRSEGSLTPVHFTLFYLCGLFAALGSIVAFLMIWVMPKFKAIFYGFDAELPDLTLAMIEASDFTARYLLFLLPLAIIGAWAVLGVSMELLGWGPVSSGPLWLASRFLPRFKTPHLLRGLGVAVDAGRPIPQALEILSQSHPDPPMRQRVARIADAVSRGEDCWQSLEQARMLKPGETAVLAAAERVGNLGWALRGMADSIERRAEYRFHLTMELVHPAAIVIMGAIIGAFTASMFIPIVALVGQLSRRLT